MSAEEIESVSILKDGSAAIYGWVQPRRCSRDNKKRYFTPEWKSRYHFKLKYVVAAIPVCAEKCWRCRLYDVEERTNFQDFGKNYLVAYQPDIF